MRLVPILAQLLAISTGSFAAAITWDELVDIESDDGFLQQRDTKPAVDSDAALGTGVAFFDPPFYPNIPSILMTGNGCSHGSADIDTGNTTDASGSTVSIESTNGASSASSAAAQADAAEHNGMATGGSWTLTFREFTAQDNQTGTTGATTPNQNARNCQTHISVGKGPPGWQVAIKTVTVRGYASLAPGSVLTATGTAATFLLAGSNSDTPPRVTRTATLINDRADDMTGLVTISLNFGTSGPWSSCMDGKSPESGILSLNFRVAVGNEALSGSNTTSTTGSSAAQSASRSTAIFGGPVTLNGPVTEKLKWIWRRCDPDAHRVAQPSGAHTTQSHASPTPTGDTPIDPDDSDF